MAINCPNCHTSILEEELPRIADATKVLCPSCLEPLTLPELTLPLGFAKTTLTPPEAGLSVGRKYSLVVVSGPDAGKVLDIRKVENTIGCDGCDLELEDPEISRRHALVSIEGVRARLRDLHSTNGTFVAEKPIEEAMLENRDQFSVGSHQVALVVTENDEVDDDE